MNNQQTLIIVAGLSGAGSSSAIDLLEDLGFFTVEHLPVPLLPECLKLIAGDPRRFSRTAMSLDIASQEKQALLLETLVKQAPLASVIFCECSTPVILKRYSETRRPHPGFDSKRDLTLADTVQRERTRLQPIKEMAHFVIDSSALSIHQFKRELEQFVLAVTKDSARTMRINFLSFGFKYGVPSDCDLLMDVRFLPNPHFIDELRDKTGLDSNVAEYVIAQADTQEFLSRYLDFLRFVIPRYVAEGKAYLNIGIGCTGGKHRSVAIAEHLSQSLSLAQSVVSAKHRDLGR